MSLFSLPGVIKLLLEVGDFRVEPEELVRKAVDELRQDVNHGSGFFVGCGEIKAFPVYGFISRKTANQAELLKPWRKIQGFDLVSKIISFATCCRNQPFKRNPEHGRSGTGRKIANALGFDKYVPGVLGHAWSGDIPSPGRVNHAAFKPDRRFAAVCANLNQENASVEKIEKVFWRYPGGVLIKSIKPVFPNQARSFIRLNNRVIRKLAESSAVRAPKAAVCVGRGC